MVTAAMKLKRHLLLGRKATTNLDSLLKSRDITLLTKILLTKYSQNCGFSSSHVWMWELDYKENWLLINWCFQTVVLEKTLESSLDYKEIKPVNPKVNPKVNFKWIFIWKTDGKVEAPIFWPPDARSRFIGKDADAGKDWRQEKGITEDEMVGWCHGLNGLSLSKLWEIVKDREAWLSGFHGVAKSGTRLSDWSELKDLIHREGAFLYVGWEKGILVMFVVWPTPCFFGSQRVLVFILLPHGHGVHCLMFSELVFIWLENI